MCRNLINPLSVKYFLLLFLFVPVCLSGQDLSGNWQGVVYQASGGLSPYYPSSLMLTQNGNAVTGYYRTENPGTPYYAILNFSGTVAASVLTWDINGIVQQVPPPAPSYWCPNANGAWTYNSTAQTLTGSGNSAGCAGLLTYEYWRLMLVSDSVFCSGEPIQVSVTGQNIKWYKDSTLHNLAYSGNTINPLLDSTTLFYVTQTHYATESPAIPVRIIVKQKGYSSLSAIICRGESYLGYTQSGTYVDTLAGAAASGCDSIRTLDLQVNELPHPDLSTDSVLCIGTGLILDPGRFSSYLWQDGSTGETFSVQQGGVYSVAVTNSCGNATATVQIAERNCNVLFPDAFTPNGDGRNDLFKVLNSYAISQYHLMVFDRWGVKVFETQDPAKGWDGNVGGVRQSMGTYVWTCTFSTRGSNVAENRKGTVTLIR